MRRNLKRLFAFAWMGALTTLAPPAWAQSIDILSCDNDQVVLSYQSKDDDFQLQLRNPAKIAEIQASTREQACAENYYSPTHGLICLNKSLADNIQIDGDRLTIEHLNRWSYGEQVQFISGQYRPSLQQTADGMLVSLRNANMANSKTLLSWENASFLLTDCEQLAEFPKAQVEVTVYVDSVRNGTLVSTPASETSIYAGEWRAGHQIGVTDPQGKFRWEAEIGANYYSVMKMTSSHSAFWSEPSYVDVKVGRNNPLSVHVAPTTVRISSKHSTAYGKALYITGETEYLGNWKFALKMNFNPNNGQWEWSRNAPIGARFKIIEADWTDSEGLYFDQKLVSWEQGDNRLIPAPSGYYEVSIQADPLF